MTPDRCPACGSIALRVDPADDLRRICDDCGTAYRIQHTLFLTLGDDELPLPAQQAEQVAADLRNQPSPQALAAAEKIDNAMGEAGDAPATNAELHQIGLALTRLQVTSGIGQHGVDLQGAIMRHSIRFGTADR